jgi:hypothetical protein
MIVSSSRPREIITFSWSAYKEQRGHAKRAFVDGRALTRKVFRTPASRRLQAPCGDIGAIIDHPTTASSITMHITNFIKPRILSLQKEKKILANRPARLRLRGRWCSE